MATLNRSVVLDILIKHETLLLTDIGKEENLGFLPNKEHLRYLLDELTEGGFLAILTSAATCTYTITAKGIIEGKRLREEMACINKTFQR